MDSKGMRVKLEKTKEVVEAFEWNNIRSQAAILNPMDHFQFKFLVLFRLVQFKESNNELHVFSCETIDIAKSFVDSISHHKKEPRKSASELKVTNDSASNGKVKRGRSEEKLNTVVDAYGRHFYMLNRCIDDIESFESRLEKAIKKRANSQEELNFQPMATPAPPHDLIEAVRKVKYALNTNEAIRPYTPERTSKKLFIRLFNTVQWLDEVCRSGCVPQYDSNMVADVVEPLLNEETISAIVNRLGTKKLEFWRNLGPNWNTPAEQWQGLRERYVPNFESPEPEERLKNQPHHENIESTSSIPRTSSVGSLTQKPNRKISTSENAKVDTVEAQEFRSNVERAGGRASLMWIEVCKESVQISILSTRRNLIRLYFSTVRHVGSKPKEINVSPGTLLELFGIVVFSWIDYTVRIIWHQMGINSALRCQLLLVSSAQKQILFFKVLDSSNVDWWVVRDQHGAEGEIPRWKLNKYDSTRQQSKVDNVMPTKSLGDFNMRQPIRTEHVIRPRPVTDVNHKHSLTSTVTITNLTVGRHSSDPTDLGHRDTETESKPVVIEPASEDRSLKAYKTVELISNPNSPIVPTTVVNHPVTVTSPTVNELTNTVRLSATQDLPVIKPAATTADSEPQSNMQPLPGGMVYMTPEQLQQLMKNSGNRSKVPMVLVPVSQLHNYTNPPSNPSELNGISTVNDANAPMQWPEFSEMETHPGTVYSPGPPMTSAFPTGSLQTGCFHEAAKDLGWGLFLLRLESILLAKHHHGDKFASTHMHTMTRELRERLLRMRDGGGTGLKAVPSPTTAGEKSFARLTKYSTKEEITQWLIARNFPEE
ncbi:epidermal growth factor receptor kinase substrate 8 [Paragonimus westermani]|uniref:Epidermal growth factor receptor kinase substrate 8 n=1 Tax=Paragonimus westermani TaxID=34504 RepID=A0A5J4NSW2_9TREM|nr:epidermal growth factor receptor kinase substrate 8 [Paragonimus westermani]